MGVFKLTAIATMALLALNGCKSQSDGSNATHTTVPNSRLIVNEGQMPGGELLASAMPRAIVYRTGADYADKVPVNIDTRSGATVG